MNYKACNRSPMKKCCIQSLIDILSRKFMKTNAHWLLVNVLASCILLKNVWHLYYQFYSLQCSLNATLNEFNTPQNCKIESIADGITAITAQGRSSPSDKSGFVFIHCNITGTGNAYLSRAWKPNSRVIFAYTYLGPLVNPKGWDDKGLSGRQR